MNNYDDERFCDMYNLYIRGHIVCIFIIFFLPSVKVTIYNSFAPPQNIKDLFCIRIIFLDLKKLKYKIVFKVIYIKI